MIKMRSYWSIVGPSTYMTVSSLEETGNVKGELYVTMEAELEGLQLPARERQGLTATTSSS